MINWYESGKRIKELRKARKISLRALAAELGVSHTAVADWEKGKSYPHKDSVAALATYFNVKPSFILTGEQIKDSDGQKLINVIDLLNEADRELIKLLVNRLLQEQQQGNGTKD